MDLQSTNIKRQNHALVRSICETIKGYGFIDLTMCVRHDNQRGMRSILYLLESGQVLVGYSCIAQDEMRRNRPEIN